MMHTQHRQDTKLPHPLTQPLFPLDVENEKVLAFKVPFSGSSALWQNDRFDRRYFAGLTLNDQRLFEAFGQGPLARPRYDTVHRGFERFADVQSNAVAIEHESKNISYGVLNAKANLLACHLMQLGVGRGDAVALYLQRSIPMVVGILAVLKIGACYVPQHMGVAPPTMLEHIAKVTGSKVILTLSEFANEVPNPNNVEIIAIDDFLSSANEIDLGNLTEFPKTLPEDRCFILFTSGTTGVPNGVQVTHRNVCNILQTSPGDLGIHPGIKVGQFLSIAFDMAAWEILGCLTNGGTLVIRGKDFQAVAEQVDVIIATPSILGTINADRCHNVKTVAVAGEPCPRPLADKWSPFCNFYNSCGPTETTIINTAELHYPSKHELSIGRPTPNNTVYILDDKMNPCAIGEVGEMWAGGDCVTAGYLANEKLTNERYSPDPFLGGGRMMFRTRDLGRWTADGELEHHGRVDDQVKIRGFRVELDSVSSALESVDGCEQAVTLKYDDRTLVSFVRPASCLPADFTETMNARLHYYCIPRVIIPLEELPKTARGKLDKRLLLEMAEGSLKAAVESTIVEAA